MRFLRFLPLLLILPAAAVPIVPQEPVRELSPDAQIGEQNYDVSLDEWFERLRFAETGEDARRIEAEIYIRMSKAESPTVNLLMESASAALASDDPETARSIYQDIVVLAPDFPEGLTRAASSAYQNGELKEAEHLLQRALAREPRHFAAWTGLGLVREDLGDLKGAQAAYKEALYFNPFQDAAKRGLLKVEAQMDGLAL